MDADLRKAVTKQFGRKHKGKRRPNGIQKFVDGWNAAAAHEAACEHPAWRAGYDAWMTAHPTIGFVGVKKRWDTPQHLQVVLEEIHEDRVALSTPFALASKAERRQRIINALWKGYEDAKKREALQDWKQYDVK